MLYIGREDLLLKKWLHHFFEVSLPFCAVWLGFVLMLVPGMQVSKLMHGRHQEGVNVQIIIYRDAVPFAAMRGPIITKLAVTIAGNLKLTLKVIYPTGYQRRRRRGKIPF